MAKSNIHAGLEIGTSKVCLVVGEVRGDGAIKILGVGQYPAAGVRKGDILDPDVVRNCIVEAHRKAGERSQVEIETVYLAVTGSHIQSLNNRGTIRVPDESAAITSDHLEEVKQIARDVSLPKENGYIHSLIQHHWVDGQDKVLNPIGMTGQKLEADYHIIHGDKTRIRNAIECVREASIEVEDIVFSPVAAAQVVLNREAKHAGSLLIDLGGGTSDYICFSDGAVVASGCIPVGGDHITNDIALVLNLPLAQAERLKVTHGNASLRDGSDREIALEGDTAGTVSQRLLNEIVNARVSELLTMIREPLAQTGCLGRFGGGIFLTGGASLTKGIAEVTENVFGIPVHGSSPSLSGPAALFENPQYATPVGLIRYAQLLQEGNPRRHPSQ